MNRILRGGLLLAGLLTALPQAMGSHSWGGYHWARTGSAFTLKLGKNISQDWEVYLATTSFDWSQSSVLDTVIVAGSTTPKTCKPRSGRVEVCNARYGSTGWLGIAQIWISSGHISQGTVKLNDTYFQTASYNTPAWRNLVSCQEVGHTFGLAHQDENFSNANLNTCMDYTSLPASNQHPNTHDYDMLQSIYAHTDNVTTVDGTGTVPPALMGLDVSSAKDWGRLVKANRDGMLETYERELLPGWRLVTHVFWAEPRGNRPHD